MFDLLNITLRNIKTKTKKPSIKNIRFHSIPSYPYLQVLHTLKLYSQFEEESKKLIRIRWFAFLVSLSLLFSLVSTNVSRIKDHVCKCVELLIHATDSA